MTSLLNMTTRVTYEKYGSRACSLHFMDERNMEISMFFYILRMKKEWKFPCSFTFCGSKEDGDFHLLLQFEDERNMEISMFICEMYLKGKEIFPSSFEFCLENSYAIFINLALNVVFPPPPPPKKKAKR